MLLLSSGKPWWLQKDMVSVTLRSALVWGSRCSVRTEITTNTIITRYVNWHTLSLVPACKTLKPHFWMNEKQLFIWSKNDKIWSCQPAIRDTRFVNIDQASESGLGKRFERYDEVRYIPSLLSAANEYRCSICIHWRGPASQTPNRISLFFWQSVSLCCSLVL